MALSNPGHAVTFDPLWVERTVVGSEQEWIDQGRPDYNAILRETFSTRFDEIAAPVRRPFHILLENSRDMGPLGFEQAKAAIRSFIETSFNPLLSSISITTFSAAGATVVTEIERDTNVLLTALDGITFSPSRPGSVSTAVDAIIAHEALDYPTGVSFYEAYMTVLDPEAARLDPQTYFNTNNFYGRFQGFSGAPFHLLFTSTITLPSSAGPCSNGTARGQLDDAFGPGSGLVIVYAGNDASPDQVECLVDDTNNQLLNVLDLEDQLAEFNGPVRDEGEFWRPYLDDWETTTAAAVPVPASLGFGIAGVLSFLALRLAGRRRGSF